MTTAKEQWAADLDATYDLFGVEVVYNDQTSSETIPAILDYGGGSGGTARTGTISVKKSDVPDPDYLHTFTDPDGLVWTVAMEKSAPKISGDGFEWTIGIIRDERANVERRAWQT